MGQPATAAIAVACIFIGAATIFFGYKAYIKWHARRYRRELELPPIRESLTAYNSAPISPSTGTLTGTLYGDQFRDSWRGSASKASLATHFDRSGSYGYGSEFNPSRRASSQVLLASPTGIPQELSSPSSPLSPPGDVSPSFLAQPPDAYEGGHGRFSSSSSTMTLKRSYAGSVYKGSGTASTGAPLSPSQKRDSYLPHLPENRDAIQIIPPQPLGFGTGGMATAVDQRTLAFSKSSGIGNNDDEYSMGLVWSDEQNEYPSGRPIGEEERMRYLAQGPFRSMSGSMSRGAGSSNLYAPSATSESRTPEGGTPSMRSHSPAQGGWDSGSYSDSSPRVLSTSHPLERSASQLSSAKPSQNGSSIPQVHHTSALQRMSDKVQAQQLFPARSPSPSWAFSQQAALEPNDHVRQQSVSTAGTRGTAQTHGGTDTTDNSPIMGAFRQTGRFNGDGRQTPGTPGFASRRGSSATGSGSYSSPTGPSTDGSSGRPSGSGSRPGEDEDAIRHQRDLTAGDGSTQLTEMSTSLGKDGKQHLVDNVQQEEMGSRKEDEESAKGQKDGKRRSRGWMIGNVLGRT